MRLELKLQTNTQNYNIRYISVLLQSNPICQLRWNSLRILNQVEQVDISGRVEQTLIFDDLYFERGFGDELLTVPFLNAILNYDLKAIEIGVAYEELKQDSNLTAQFACTSAVFIEAPDLQPNEIWSVEKSAVWKGIVDLHKVEIAESLRYA